MELNVLIWGGKITITNTVSNDKKRSLFFEKIYYIKKVIFMMIN